MKDIFTLSLLPVFLTLAAFRLGQWCQKTGKLPLFNPILLGAGFILIFLLATKMELQDYLSGNKVLSWLMTPATISLAIPMYQQLQVLKKDLRAILAGVAAGSVSSLLIIGISCALLGLDDSLSIALLPKSVTSAIGAPLSEMYGGLPGVTMAVIILTGVLANMAGPFLCRFFRITDPAAQGAAFGTAGHVIGTAKASELSPLTGAVSSLSLVVSGLLTAVLFPVVTRLLVL